MKSIESFLQIRTHDISRTVFGWHTDWKSSCSHINNSTHNETLRMRWRKMLILTLILFNVPSNRTCVSMFFGFFPWAVEMNTHSSRSVDQNCWIMSLERRYRCVSPLMCRQKWIITIRSKSAVIHQMITVKASNWLFRVFREIHFNYQPHDCEMVKVHFSHSMEIKHRSRTFNK